MSKKFKIALFIILSFIVVTGIATLLLQDSSIAVLNPKGVVAQQERDLIVFASLLSLVIILPVFSLTFFIAWKYRVGNKNAKYTPDWDHSRILETIWWAIPFAIILVLAVITWKSTHELDPFKPLNASAKPIKIQVVALQWKWLFIYPEQNIASVNFVQFPENTPIDFEITSDAPMNSFWIPQLGGQIYAMAGMSTQLHLMADETGSYNGSSANISGQGFAGMKFIAKSSSQFDFDRWVQSLKQSEKFLSFDEYKKLAKPSENNPPAYYSRAEQGLYNRIIVKYMMPAQEMENEHHGTLNLDYQTGHHN